MQDLQDFFRVDWFVRRLCSDRFSAIITLLLIEKVSELMDRLDSFVDAGVHLRQTVRANKPECLHRHSMLRSGLHSHSFIHSLIYSNYSHLILLPLPVQAKSTTNPQHKTSCWSTEVAVNWANQLDHCHY